MLALLSGVAQWSIDARADLPSQGRDDGVGFSFDGFGYILGGRQSDFAISPELWRYEPISDAWELVSLIPGAARQYAEAQVLGDEVYIIGGLADPGLFLDEVWRYRPGADLWTPLSPFPGGGRIGAVSFVFNETLYFGLGRNSDSVFRDIYRYEESTDTWELAFELTTPLHQAAAVSLGTHVLIIGGLTTLDNADVSERAWIWDGQELSIRPAPWPYRAYADIAFVQGRVLLIGGRMSDGTYLRDITAGTMVQRAGGQFVLDWSTIGHLPNGARSNGASYTIDEVAYYFGGKDEEQNKYGELTSIELDISESPFAFQTLDGSLRLDQLPNGPWRLFDIAGRLVTNGTKTGNQVIQIDIPTSGIYLFEDAQGQVLKLFFLAR